MVRDLLFLCLLLTCPSCKDVPISFDAPTAFVAGQPALFTSDVLVKAGKHLMLEGKDFAAPVPLQKTVDGRWCFIAPRLINHGEKLVVKEYLGDVESPCLILRYEGHIVAKIGDVEVLRYAVETQYPEAPLPDYYRRSGFVHPIKTRTGVTLTEGFPEGHVHQHGLFHAWTRTHMRDSMIDFWNQQSQLGTVRHKEVLGIENGPVFASFEVGLEYLAYLGQDTFVAAEEKWEIRITPLPEDYVIDWSLVQEKVGTDSLLIDKYHYGGAAFRGTDEWNVEGGAYDSLVFISTDARASQIDGNHSRPRWVSMHGLVGDSYGGVAMMGHQTNFRHPQPVRIHPVMPYFCFAPMVTDHFVLHPGDLYEASYRLLVYDGKPKDQVINRVEQAYNTPGI